MTSTAVRQTSDILRKLGMRYSAVCLLACFIILFSLISPDTFPTTITFQVIVNQQVQVGLLALAVLIALIGGAYDLSVGSMLSFSIMVSTWLFNQTHLNGVLISLIAIIACCMVGWINGFVVLRLHVNSFIATLAMSQVLSALVLLGSNNTTVTANVPAGFMSFFQKSFGGIGIPFFMLLALALIVWHVLENMPTGRRLYATGSNEEAARLTGVRTSRLTWGALISAAGISGLAGVIFTGQVAILSSSYGPPLLFPAFAAVFFGATQLRGQPNVWGTLIAVYALATGVEGIQLSTGNDAVWVTPLLNGVALLITVALASNVVLGKRRLIGRSRQAASAESGLGHDPAAGADPQIAAR